MVRYGCKMGTYYREITNWEKDRSTYTHNRCTLSNISCLFVITEFVITGLVLTVFKVFTVFLSSCNHC